MDSPFRGISVKPHICQPLQVHDDGDLAISAAVGARGKNVPDDVTTIQDALNQVPPGEGGPVPALDVDGRCGPLTIEAISRFQKAQLGWSDGRVDPNNVTIAKLRTYADEDSPGVAEAAGPRKAKPHKKHKKPRPPDQLDKEIMKLVYLHLKAAQRWIFWGDQTAGRAQDYLTGNGTSLFKKEAEKAYALCNKYFKFKGLHRATILSQLTFIRNIFAKVRTCIGHQLDLDFETNWAVGWYQVDSTSNNNEHAKDIMFTYPGGFTRRTPDGKPRWSKDDHYAGPNLREDGIYVATKWWAQRLKSGGTWDDMIKVIVHEAVHFVGPEKGNPNLITDHGYIWETTKFEHLNNYLAMRNAESYAVYCAAATPGVSLDNLV
jgi:hypothetical protein